MIVLIQPELIYDAGLSPWGAVGDRTSRDRDDTSGVLFTLARLDRWFGLCRGTRRLVAEGERGTISCEFETAEGRRSGLLISMDGGPIKSLFTFSTACGVCGRSMV